MTPQEIHNRDAGRITDAIIRPTLAAGGEFTDVLVLLESVITGVILFAVKSGGDEMVLDLLMTHVRDRLAELRREPAKNN